MISLKQAIEKLRAGDIVALPTETVYGLAGRCDQQSALEKIFSTKKRPFFDPLILHVRNLEQAKEYGQWDEVSEKLARSFWPGPLTLILPKTTRVLPIVNNGMDSVALRNPRHSVFQEVLNQLPCPLAAPSANRFGKTSPTSADHVLDEFSSEVSVVDGGACEEGIESTVIQVDPQKKEIIVLRPGLIGKQQLQPLTDYKIEFADSRNQNSPGQLKNHYQPESLLVLLESEEDPTEFESWKDLLKNPPAFSIWNLPQDPSLAARQLYGDLREFSKNNRPCVIFLKTLQSQDPLCKALLDRLQKASHFRFQWREKKWQLLDS